MRQPKERKFMKIEVRRKDGHTVPQPTTKKWERGYIVGFVTMGDGVGYAVVQTEHGEFETVAIRSLQTYTI